MKIIEVSKCSQILLAISYELQANFFDLNHFLKNRKKTAFHVVKLYDSDILKGSKR